MTNVNWREMLNEVDEETVREAYMEQEEVQDFLSIYNYCSDEDVYGVFMELETIAHELTNHFNKISNADINDNIKDLEEHIVNTLESFAILKTLVYLNYDNIEELKPLNIGFTDFKKMNERSNDIYYKSILEKHFG